MLAFAWFRKNVIRERSKQAPPNGESRAKAGAIDWFANSLAKCAFVLSVPMVAERRSEEFVFDDCADWLGLSDEEYRAQLPKDLRHARERVADFIQHRSRGTRPEKWPWRW